MTNGDANRPPVANAGTNQSVHVGAVATLDGSGINKLNSVIADVNAGHYDDAISQPRNDLLAKTDGCAASGSPDRNDWIVDCGGQGQVYPYPTNLIELVQSMK